MLNMLIGSVFTLIILSIGIALGYYLSSKESIDLKKKLTKAKHSLKVKNQKSEIITAITAKEIRDKETAPEQRAIGNILEDGNWSGGLERVSDDMSRLR